MASRPSFGRHRQIWILSWLFTLVICSIDLYRRKKRDDFKHPLLHQYDKRDYSLLQQNKNGSDDDIVKVYSPTNSTSNVAMCILVRNETLYFDEWIDYQIALGFSPIYIYDNSDDFELMYGMHSGIYSWYDTRSDIREHIRLVHYPTMDRYVNGYSVTAAHYPAFDQCVKQDAINSTFAALFDADEFLVLKTDKFDNVVDFMDHYCPESCGQLSINWRNMGISNQKQYTPVPVTRRNVNWNPWESQSGFVKAIVRPTYVADRSRHYVHVVDLKKGNHLDTTGRPVQVKFNFQNERAVDDVAVLFHYGTKSEGEFHYKTCVKKRDDVKGLSFCGQQGKGNYKYFSVYNGTIFDDSAWKQLTRMVPKYRRNREAENVTFEASEGYALWLKSQQ